jgi:hypothetical protein
MAAEQYSKAKDNTEYRYTKSQSPAYSFLATFFNFEITGLADRFLMEIVGNVNKGRKNGGVQRYLLRTEKIFNLK